MFKLLSGFPEFSRCGQLLVVGKIFRRLVDECFEIPSGLEGTGRRLCALRRFRGGAQRGIKTPVGIKIIPTAIRLSCSSLLAGESRKVMLTVILWDSGFLFSQVQRSMW